MSVGMMLPAHCWPASVQQQETGDRLSVPMRNNKPQHHHQQRLSATSDCWQTAPSHMSSTQRIYSSDSQGRISKYPSSTAHITPQSLNNTPRSSTLTKQEAFTPQNVEKKKRKFIICTSSSLV